MDKLAETQVAQILDPDQDLVVRDDTPWGGYTVQFDDNEPDIAPMDAMRALALEVQQARARRCDNCSWFNRGGRVSPWGACDNHDGATYDETVAPDWFCADFTAKPVDGPDPAL